MAVGFYCCRLIKHGVAAAFGVRLRASSGEKGKEITEWDDKRGRGEARKEKHEKQKRNAMDMSLDKLQSLATAHSFHASFICIAVCPQSYHFQSLILTGTVNLAVIPSNRVK